MVFAYKSPKAMKMQMGAGIAHAPEDHSLSLLLWNWRQIWATKFGYLQDQDILTCLWSFQLINVLEDAFLFLEENSLYKSLVGW